MARNFAPEFSANDLKSRHYPAFGGWFFQQLRTKAGGPSGAIGSVALLRLGGRGQRIHLAGRHRCGRDALVENPFDRDDLHAAKLLAG